MYAHLCLVTSYQNGAPEVDSYDYYDRYSYRYDDDDDDFEDRRTDAIDETIDEVFEQSTYIEHWLTHSPPIIELGDLNDEDLIVNFKLEDGNPIESEKTEYMGNWGPELSFWYHYGAVVIWSKDTNAKLLETSSMYNALEWINYFIQEKSASEKEKEGIRKLIHSNNFFPEINEQFFWKYSKGDSISFERLIDWVLQEKEVSFIEKLDAFQLKSAFLHLSTNDWIRLLSEMDVNQRCAIFDKTKELESPGQIHFLRKWVELLNELSHLSDFKEVVSLAKNRIENFLTLTPSSKLNENDFKLLLSIAENNVYNEKETQSLFLALTQKYNRTFVHKLGEALIANSSFTNELFRKSFEFCLHFLQAKVDNPPEKPTDWVRHLPKSTKESKERELLQDFMNSPEQEAFNYSARQNLRENMEYYVTNNKLDLKMHTIKKGSPYTLVLTKNFRTYNRLMKEWNEDKILFGKLENSKN